MDLATAGQTKAAVVWTIKSIQLPQVPVSWGSRLNPSPRPPLVYVWIAHHPRSSLCNVFDSAHVIVQVWGRSGPCGSGHIRTTPTQVLFILLILFASRH